MWMILSRVYLASTLDIMYMIKYTRLSPSLGGRAWERVNWISTAQVLVMESLSALLDRKVPVSWRVHNQSSLRVYAAAQWHLCKTTSLVLTPSSWHIECSSVVCIEVTSVVQMEITPVWCERGYFCAAIWGHGCDVTAIVNRSKWPPTPKIGLVRAAMFVHLWLLPPMILKWCNVVDATSKPCLKPKMMISRAF